MKTILSIAAAFLFAVSPAGAANMSFHDFTFEAIEGGDLPASTFAGKAVLVVNTASHCGFTKQYTNLQSVWDQYKDKGLVVLGVPSNDFGGQEPGSEQEIKEFCEVNFSVDFPMTGKVKVKGDNAHPFYQWARDQVGMVGSPKWNFHKYLIAPDGSLRDWFSTPTEPTSKKITKAIEAVLPN